MSGHGKRMFTEEVFIRASFYLAGARALAREGADDTNARMEDQERFDNIEDLLKKYTEAIEEIMDKEAA